MYPNNYFAKAQAQQHFQDLQREAGAVWLAEKFSVPPDRRPEPN